MAIPSHCPGCGLVLKQKRSPQMHKFFFAGISAAFENWPETHAFQPQNEDHLRHYLQVRAGHCDIIGHSLNGGPGDAVRMAEFAGRMLEKARLSGSAGFVEVAGDRSILCRFPRSINWREVDQAEFAPVAEAIFEIIELEVGVAVGDLVRGREMAA